MKSRKRSLLSLIACVGTGALLVGCAGQGDSDSKGSSETLNVTLFNHGWTTEIMERIPEFEEATGIKVDVNAYGEDQLSDQLNVKLNAGSDDMDVIMYRPMQEARQFVQNQWLADLSDYVDATDESYDWADFQKSSISALTIDDQLAGVPVTTERQVLFYRKDLLEKAGLEVPSTFEELAAAAEALHDPENGVYGFVGRGARSQAVTQLSSFLYGFGGDWNDGTKSTVDSDAAIKAYEYYGGLLNDFGPSGTADMGWPEAVGVFSQGRAAFYPEGDSHFINFIDPAKSSVVDTWGATVIPAGPAGSRPYNVPNNALGINEFSQNKDNAWKFIEWATTPEMILDLQKAGVPSARDSAWADPSGTEGFPADLTAAILASVENGVDHDRPVVNQVGLAREIVGGPLVVAQEGGDVKAAAKSANSEFNSFLESD